jgi:hypothetical protein
MSSLLIPERWPFPIVPKGRRIPASEVFLRLFSSLSRPFGPKARPPVKKWPRAR